MRRSLLYISLLAAQMVAAWPTDKCLFRTLGSADGLSSNSVVCLLADSRGYLWIGTDQGLNRYDGHEVKTRFAEERDPSLHEIFNASIHSLQEDADGRLWIECEQGSYYIYDTKTARFSNSDDGLLRDLGIPVSGKYRVKIGDKGTIWVLMEKGIWRYDCHTAHLKSWEIHHMAVPEASRQVVAETSDGIWFSAAHGIWQFIVSTGELLRMPLPEGMGKTADDNLGVITDADGTLWIYSTQREQLCRYSVGGRNVKEMVRLPEMANASQNNAIRDVADDRLGHIWIATDHGGVMVYNKKTGDITPLRHHREQLLSLSSDNATCLTIDGEGTVWVGHLKTGLSYTSEAYNVLQPHAWACGDILTMAYDEQGNLWMGTDGNGVYIETPDHRIVKTSLPNITVMALTGDGHGGMWAGTYNQGLYHLLSPSQYRRYSTDDKTFPTDYVWTLAKDGQGHVWTSSSRGMTVIFDEQEETSQVVLADGKDDIHGNSLCFDGNHTMYIASVYGLWRYDLSKKECDVTFGNKKGTQQWMSQMITGVSVDTRQHLMVLCHQKGITVYDMKADSLYYAHHSSDIIKSMIRDKEGNTWLCTSSGNVTCMTPERKGTSLEFKTKSFTMREALSQFSFNGGAAVFSPRNEILLGGTEGYMALSPRTFMAAKKDQHRLILSEIAVGDSLLNELTTHVRLKHDAAFLTVKFFAGSLLGVENTRYAYRLMGHMDDWVTTDRNEVSFHALPPGDYILQLCVCGEDGSMLDPTELRISVAPPFFRTLPMYIVYLLTALLALFLLWRRARQRHRERIDRQRQIMERQKMEQISEMKLQFFTNISHDLRTPLTLIISPIEQMVRKMELGKVPDNLLGQLKNIRKNAQQLLSEVNSLLDFRRLDVGVETLTATSGDIVDLLNSILVSFADYAEERQIHLSFAHEFPAFIMDYDREKMNKVIYNLLSNALKFTPAGGKIQVGFRSEDDKVVITVADTGKGIPDADKANIFKRFYQSASNDSSQTGSGIGLHIANDYVGLHHGTISVSDNIPHGSIFTIVLPVNQSQESVAAIPKQQEEQHPVSDVSTQPIILVVDDNQDMLSFVSSCMAESYHVCTATDGRMALDILGREQVSLIISDVMMPGIDGFELCRRVKTDINLSHIPVILLTARTTDVSRIEGLQQGADDYLTKPFNVEVLKLRVERLMEWARNSHRQFRQKMNIEPSEITITPLDEQFIQKAIKLVEQHISDSDYSVETLGAEVGMSRSTLYKKLMAITGQGPAEFIRTIRIKRGKALLDSSQMQITEIAYAVGFTTVKSFTMNFKAEYGMTPSEYVKRHGA